MIKQIQSAGLKVNAHQTVGGDSMAEFVYNFKDETDSRQYCLGAPCMYKNEFVNPPNGMGYWVCSLNDLECLVNNKCPVRVR